MYLWPPSVTLTVMRAIRNMGFARPLDAVNMCAKFIQQPSSCWRVCRQGYLGHNILHFLKSYVSNIIHFLKSYVSNILHFLKSYVSILYYTIVYDYMTLYNCFAGASVYCTMVTKVQVVWHCKKGLSTSVYKRWTFRGNCNNTDKDKEDKNGRRYLCTEDAAEWKIWLTKRN